MLTMFVGSHVAFSVPLVELRQIENLPQSDVNDIFEDSRGFMWIATLDGLFRYDGSSYRSYQMNFTQNSISSNMIFSINEDLNGNIWVGTYARGLNRIDVHTGKITNYSLVELLGDELWIDDILTIEIDRDNRVWLGNRCGVVIIAFKDGGDEVESVKSYPLDGVQFANNDFVNKIHQDRHGQIWIGGNMTLRRVLAVKDAELVCETLPVRCSDICDYDNSSIVVVSEDVTLVRRDPQSGKYSDCRKIYTVQNSLQIESRYGLIAIGGRHGVVKIRPTGDGTWVEMESIRRTNVPFALVSETVTSLTLTRDDQLWIGIRGGGIVTANDKFKEFSNHPSRRREESLSRGIVKALYEDTKGGFWVGTEDKGLFYKPKRGSYQRDFQNFMVNKYDNRVYAIEQTGGEGKQRGVIWAGTCYPTGLIAIDMESMKPMPRDNRLQGLGFVFSLKKSDNNTLWAGTYNNGLWRLRLNDRGEVVKMDNFRLRNSTISSNIIRSIYIAQSGDMWFGCDVGIIRIDKGDINADSPQFKRTLCDGCDLTLNDYYTLQIMEDDAGRMLFATMGDGLIICDREAEGEKLHFLNTRNGLPNNSVKSILEDPITKYLWMSTNKGIVRYNPMDGSTVAHSRADGLNDSEFSEMCGVRRENGEMIFGNRFGIVSFRPERIPVSQRPPELYFTDLYINHKRIEVGEQGDGARRILDREMEYTEEVELKYDERNFSVAFVGINFISPMGNRFEYKLEGVDPEWRKHNGNRCVAQYTNIREGSYRLRVRAANSDGIWTQERSLNIKVSPPWHRTAVAYMIYILLLVLLILLVYRVVSTLNNKSREALVAQIEQKRAEEMVQYKLEFFVNISHEFRTPLTLINIPLESLISNMSKLCDKDMRNDVMEMKQNVDLLLRLVNQLLDFSKIEKGQQSVNLQCVEINDYLEPYFNQFRPLAQKRDVEYHFEPLSELAAINIDLTLFEKVIFNILANAFKYSNVGGEVSLKVRHDAVRDVLTIELKNSGEGVAKEELPKLFNRFYQAQNKESSFVSGSGIGLSLCESIVVLHGGEMRVDSTQGEGFTCYIDMPCVAYDKSLIVEVHEPINDYASMDEGLVEELPTEMLPSRRLILVVEDNRRMRNQLLKHLSDQYNVVSAKNGVEGLERCIKEHPDLVITDVMMPVMDGIEMCRQIKCCEEVSHTPILVMTANSTVKCQIDSFTIGGADGYLDKPFSIELLKSNVQTILRNREAMLSRFQNNPVVEPKEIVRTPIDQRYMSQLLEIIERNMSNSELSVESIATEFGVSRIYLNRKIKALTGETSAQFIRNVRLKRAAELILAREMTVSEVAWAVGYNDIDTFRVRFKEKFGVVPTAYVERA